ADDSNGRDTTGTPRDASRSPRAERDEPERDRAEEDEEPPDVCLRLEHVREEMPRPAALHDLFEPEVVRDVPEPVGDEERADEAGRDMQPRRPDRAEEPRQEQPGDHEKRSLEPVVIAVVDGRMQEVRPRLVAKLVRLEDLPEDGNVREVRADLGGEPR